MIYHTQDVEDGLYSLDDLDKEARRACIDIQPHLGEFDVIAVTGLSGVLPAVPVSLQLKVPLAILRKESDDSHQGGGRWINAAALTSGCRVLWLDDFVSNGTTRRRIAEAVKLRGGVVVAEYLTRDRDYRDYQRVT